MCARQQPGPETPLESDGGQLSALVVETWQRGEARLYQSAIWDPEVYQRSVEFIRRTLDHLRSLGPGSAALLTAAERGPDLIRDVLADPTPSRPMSGVQPTADLDLTGIVQAALAMRQREVAHDQVRARRLGRIAEARRHGDAWVVLEESGEPSGDLLQPYRRIEAAVATGRALLISAVADDSFGECIHRVEPGHVDLESGTLEETKDDLIEASTHPGAQAREERVLRLRENWRDR